MEARAEARYYQDILDGTGADYQPYAAHRAETSQSQRVSGRCSHSWWVRHRQEARGTTGTSGERCRGQWGELRDPRHGFCI
ncbi:hypothetical protein KI387_043733 [Taxus chinensis]|uniref:Uncharacterized protein n=1 Tax=Taxus chinensis TaxID=29808 RepID=A0AA38LL66_TAXCH|nr:hypothetical protein KI387_043733 [Taxus chinensis]